MKFSIAAVLGLALGIAGSSSGADSPPAGSVRMGAGSMTFDTVPGWALGADGKPVIGSTHGGVVVDRDGNVGTSSHLGFFVLAPDGKVVRSFRGEPYADMHDIKLVDEGGTEFIYGARNENAEGIKFDARTGAVALRLPFPEASGLKLPRLKPTAIAVAPDGSIFLADGYSSNVIFKFDKDGKYLLHFGAKGNGPAEFSTCHGMNLDARYSPPRLLICDREHQPSGRLVHYDLDGKYLGEVATGLGRPSSTAIRGDHVAVPNLEGRVAILDKSNTIVAILGHNDDPKQRANYGVRQADWPNGRFTACHGSAWDKDGNLYVQDWNVDGRITKLVRVK